MRGELYNITFQQMEAFLNIAKYRNLSKAAEAMYISQPSLSKTLQRFEEGIKIKLFTRGNHGVELTAEGEYLYPIMESLYENLNVAIDKAAGLADMYPKTIRIAMPATYDVSSGYTEAIRVINDFEVKHPEIMLIHSLGSFKELRQALDSQKVDLVVTLDSVVKNASNVSYKIISEFKMFLAIAADHPLSSKEVLPINELNSEIVYREGVNSREIDTAVTLGQCERMGFTPRSVEYVDNFQTLYHLILTKRGISICGRFDSIGKEGDIKFYPLDSSIVERFVIIAWSTNRLTQEAHKLVNSIKGDVING